MGGSWGRGWGGDGWYGVQKKTDPGLTVFARGRISQLLDAGAHLLRGPDLPRLVEDVLRDELVAVREAAQAPRRLALRRRVFLEPCVRAA